MTNLKDIADLGAALYEAEKEVLRLSELLKHATKKRDAIAQVDLPAMMDAAEMRSFESKEFSLEIVDALHVSPKVDNRPRVLQELENQGAGALIKHTLTAYFNRGEDITPAINALQLLGKCPDVEKKVEPATLKKWVKTKMEAGEVLDSELFGIRSFRQAKFSKGAPVVPVFDGEQNHE
jgi:hypothetical protein